MALRARKVSGASEKQAPGVWRYASSHANARVIHSHGQYSRVSLVNNASRMLTGVPSQTSHRYSVYIQDIFFHLLVFYRLVPHSLLLSILSYFAHVSCTKLITFVREPENTGVLRRKNT